MESRGTDPYQRRRQQNHREAAHIGQHHNPHQRTKRAQRQQIRHGLAVGIEPDPRLQQGSRDLERQGNQPDLGKTQAIVGLEQGVDRRQDRLDQVVDQVRQGTGGDDAHHQRAALAYTRNSGGTAGNIAHGHGEIFPISDLDPNYPESADLRASEFYRPQSHGDAKRLIACINFLKKGLTHIRSQRIMRATWLHSSVG
ncbi:hypothetical protein D3C80_1330450 [compost metagenome]